MRNKNFELFTLQGLVGNEFSKDGSLFFDLSVYFNICTVFGSTNKICFENHVYLLMVYMLIKMLPNHCSLNST